MIFYNKVQCTKSLSVASFVSRRAHRFLALPLLTVFAIVMPGCALEQEYESSQDEARNSGGRGPVNADPSKVRGTQFEASAALTAPGTLTMSGGYVGMTVALEPVTELRTQLNNGLFGANATTRLVDRGNDAHITLLTPQEYSSLGRSADAVIKKVAAKRLTSAQWRARCVGMGVDKNNPKLQTYYVVVDSEAIAQFRADLKAELGEFGDERNDPYHPHVTIAFTQKDLFNQNFAPQSHKDDGSCLSPANLRLR
jgi:2'-5' RNA ligase